MLADDISGQKSNPKQGRVQILDHLLFERLLLKLVLFLAMTDFIKKYDFKGQFRKLPEFRTSIRTNDMKSNKYQEAEKRVKKKKEFREHLKSFIVVNAIMLGMGWMYGFFNAWQTVIFFWGIGLVFHYVDAYGIPGMGSDEDWEKKEMEKELRNLGATENDIKTEQGKPGADEFLDLDSPRPIEQKKYDEEDLV